MTAAFRPPSACPACAPVIPAPPAEDARAGDRRIMLSLPGIHCQSCIAGVESGLTALSGVRSARVNLTQKRVTLTAAPDTTAADLIEALARMGFEAHELDPGALEATQTDPAGRALLIRLAVSGFAAMNVMLLSISVWSGATDATRDMFHWISAAIALPAIAYAAQPFFANAWPALRAWRLNMDVPITIAILLTLATSVYETALSGEHAYFDAALALTFFLLAGRYLDHRTRSAARSAARELTALEVPRALKLDPTPREVPVAEIRAGDRILVRPGARIPVDGIVTEGRSELDRSLMTGETMPEAVEPGKAVSTGEQNLTGPLTLRATAVGKDSSLARLADLVAIAEAGRSNYTSLADAAAKLYAPGVHILSALAFLGWLLWTGDLRLALNIAAAVLIITCPCALGLAVPAVTASASGRLFRKGLLIKHPTALERLARTDTVVFDKTGTLTQGRPDLIATDDHSDADLAIALALAEPSAHPLARALAEAARKRGIKPAMVEDLQERPGYGTSARMDGRRVRLGRADWIGARPGDEIETWLDTGNGQSARPFRFVDRLRPGAAELVANLRAAGVRVLLLSGDSDGVVARIARQLDIDDWQARAQPSEKAARIAALRASGAHVLMVGDGLNDTAALAAADVSISPASALDAARAASDIVLLGNDLVPIATACRMARQATARIRENFRIATLYNLLAIPLAAAGLVTPLIAALAMSASSITVSLNALRLEDRK